MPSHLRSAPIGAAIASNSGSINVAIVRRIGWTGAVTASITG
jgi:hypothetical protein